MESLGLRRLYNAAIVPLQFEMEANMKAIKDCEWIVFEDEKGFWTAATDTVNGLRYGVLNSEKMSDLPLKEDWLRFAKLNGITKWKWAE